VSELLSHAITAGGAATVAVFLLYYGLAAFVAHKNPDALRHLAPMHPRAVVRFWRKPRG